MAGTLNGCTNCGSGGCACCFSEDSVTIERVGGSGTNPDCFQLEVSLTVGDDYTGTVDGLTLDTVAGTLTDGYAAVECGGVRNNIVPGPPSGGTVGKWGGGKPEAFAALIPPPGVAIAENTTGFLSWTVGVPLTGGGAAVAEIDAGDATRVNVLCDGVYQVAWNASTDNTVGDAGGTVTDRLIVTELLTNGAVYSSTHAAGGASFPGDLRFDPPADFVEVSLTAGDFLQVNFRHRNNLAAAADIEGNLVLVRRGDT